MTKGQQKAVFYHDFFDYPLTEDELFKWEVGRGLIKIKKKVVFKSGYYFVCGREDLIKQRLQREKIAQAKFHLVQKCLLVFRLNPLVKLVAVTGALAMHNTKKASDIDLLVITKAGFLWTTRLITYLLIKFFGIPIREPGEKDEKDKLCLNMWFDESDLVWSKKDRNLYTAHEIAQIIPLINKGEVYEKFLWQNRWLSTFWPKAVKIKKTVSKGGLKSGLFFERLAFWLQRRYMGKKITKEVITLKRAIFHPINRENIVLGRLGKN